MLEAFFVLSAVCSLLFIFSMVLDKRMPVPLLH